MNPRMMLQFIRAIIKWWKADCELVTGHVYEHRKSICSRCFYSTHYMKSQRFASCLECGCWIGLKTACAFEACPKGRWTDEI